MAVAAGNGGTHRFAVGLTVADACLLYTSWAKVFGFIGRWMPLPGAERTVAADPAEKPV